MRISSASKTAVRPTVRGPLFGGSTIGVPGDPAALWLIKNGILQPDSIGISITDKANVRAEIWALLYDENDDPYTDEQRIINIEASPYLNNGWELTGDAAIGYAVYPEGTAEATLMRAYRYFGKTYTSFGICTTNLVGEYDYDEIYYDDYLTDLSATGTHEAVPSRYINIDPGKTITGFDADAALVSHAGTATVALSAGTISCSGAGTLFDIVLDNGITYSCADGVGTSLYPDQAAGEIATMVGFATDDGDRLESVVTGHSINRQSYSTVPSTDLVYLEPEGVTEIPAGTTILSNTGYFKRTADRVNLGAVAGPTTVLTDFSQFVRGVNEPNTWEQWVDANGKLGLHFAHDGSTVSTHGTAPIFPVVAGRIYEFTGRNKIVTSTNNEWNIVTSLGGTILDDDHTDLECANLYDGPVRKFYTATFTGFVALSFNLSFNGQPVDIYVSDIQCREVIPTVKNDRLTGRVAVWGDSLGVYLAQMLRSHITNGTIFSGAVGGAKSYHIRDNFYSHPELWGADVFHIIQIGTNNLAEPDVIIRDAKLMVARLPVDNWVICTPPGGNTATIGTAARTNIDYIRAQYIDIFGADKVLDLEAEIINAYDPTLPQDVLDYNNGITPDSLRYDSIHWTVAGTEIAVNHIVSSKPQLLSFSAQTFASPQMFAGTARNNLDMYAYVATMAGGETLTLGHLVGTETVIYKTGTATVAVSVDTLTFGAGTVGRVILSDGTDLIFQNVKNHAGLTVYNVDGTERHGTLSAGVGYTALLSSSYYVTNSLVAPYYSATSTITGNNSTFSGAGGWNAQGVTMSINGTAPGKMHITYDGGVLDKVVIFAAQSGLIAGQTYRFTLKIARFSGTNPFKIFTLDSGAAETYFEINPPADGVEREYEGVVTVGAGGSLFIGVFTSSSAINGTVITVDDFTAHKLISSTIPYGDMTPFAPTAGLIAFRAALSAEMYDADEDRVWFNVDGTQKDVDPNALVAAGTHQYVGATSLLIYDGDVSAECDSKALVWIDRTK